MQARILHRMDPSALRVIQAEHVARVRVQFDLGPAFVSGADHLAQPVLAVPAGLDPGSPDQ